MQKFGIFTIIALVAACTSPDNKEDRDSGAAPSDTVIVPAPSDSIDTDKPEYPTLSQENHEEVLTDFWEKNDERVLRLVTSKGNIDIRLSDQTPIHSSTFLMLAKRDYFDETLFTRVVPDFIIQGGSSDKDEIELKRMLIGSFNPKPEFRDDLFHKRGAVSMARRYKNNPDKLSTPYSFFIVIGRTFNTPEIMAIERDEDKEFSPAEEEVYAQLGGAPHLDGEHTVFGEVIAGMDIADKISEVETDSGEWPKQDIVIEDVEILR